MALFTSTKTKNNMRKLLTIFLVLLAVANTYAQNYKVIDQVIWVVGDEPILYSDIENEIQRRKYEKEQRKLHRKAVRLSKGKEKKAYGKKGKPRKIAGL